MSVKPNTEFKMESYEVTDTGLDITFLCGDPGPGQVNLYVVHVLDDELLAAPDIPQLIQDKLNRKIRGLGLAAKIDGLIGAKYTV